MRIVWSGPARADLQSIFDYIANDNPSLVVRRIRDRVGQLERAPRIG